MKIRKLLEAEFETNVQKFKSKNVFNYEQDKKRRNERTGSDKEGHFGRVYDKPDQHTLTKVPHQASTKDGYLIYIRYIVNNKLAQNNPFFPRVYDLKEWKDKNGYTKYKVELERLFPIENEEVEVIKGLCESLFSNHKIEKTFHKVNGWGFSDERKEWSTILAILIEACILGDGSVASTNNLLNSACEQIRGNLLKGNILDLHYGNIMVRKSPYPQVVIVDPIM